MADDPSLVTSLQTENRDLIHQNELYEIAVVKYTQELAMLKAELIASEAHRERTRRWLRGELNYDPFDLAPHVCLWCGTMIEGGRQGAKDHATSCADNPLVARCDQFQKLLTGPIRQTDGATLEDLINEMCSGELCGADAWKASEAIGTLIYGVMNPILNPTPEKAADDAATVQHRDGSRQDL